MNQPPTDSICEINLILNTSNIPEKTTFPFKANTTQDKLTQQPNKQNQIQEQQQRVKSKARKIFIGLIISLSALMFGYSLKQITSISIQTLVQVYSITISPFAAQSILIGILPIGSVFGSILTKFLIKKFRRLSGIYIFTFVNIGAVVLVNITTFTTAIVGRFLEGICIGYYSAIAPIYLREIAPKELRSMLGLFFSLGKAIGVIVVIVLQLILQSYHVEITWRIILSMTAVFSTLQAVLIFLFGSDTPTEHLQKGQKQQALQIIKKFYREKYVEEVYNEYTEQYQAQIGKNKQTMSQNLNEQKVKKRQYKYQVNLQKKTSKHILPQPIFPTKRILPEDQKSEESSQQQYRSQVHQKKHQFNIEIPTLEQRNRTKKQAETDKLTFEEKKQMAYVLGVHLCVVRHFIGGNAIITQGGLFIKNLNSGLGHYTSLIINLVQLAFVVIGLLYLKSIMGKKPMFLLSIAVLSIFDISLAVAMIFHHVLAAMMIMIIYMMVYGAMFISPVWAYPSEIIPANQSLLANIMHWIALAISTLVPPIITGIMPNNNPYPVFIFFGLYGFLGFLHVKFKLRESDGFNYNQIIRSFK